MKKFLKTIGSLRITIAVVLLIAGASLYGTLLKQQEAMDTVYRSFWFIALLAFFGANLLACTVLRLRLRLAQAGFLATHLGVLTILAGAIVGFLSGSSYTHSARRWRMKSGIRQLYGSGPARMLQSWRRL
jgi:cytochrome c biogenesis protein ResB